MAGPKAMGAVISEASPNIFTTVNPLAAVNTLKTFFYFKTHFICLFKTISKLKSIIPLEKGCLIVQNRVNAQK